MCAIYMPSYSAYEVSFKSPQVGTHSGFSQNGGRAHSKYGKTSTTGAKGRGVVLLIT